MTIVNLRGTERGCFCSLRLTDDLDCFISVFHDSRILEPFVMMRSVGIQERGKNLNVRSDSDFDRRTKRMLFCLGIPGT